MNLFAILMTGFILSGSIKTALFDVPLMDIPVSERSAEVWRTPRHAAGWPTNTPVFGSVGTTVLIGHKTTVFDELDQMQIGHVMTVTHRAIIYRYKVTDILHFPNAANDPAQEAAALESLRSQPGITRLAVMTCTGAYNQGRLVLYLEESKKGR